MSFSDRAPRTTNPNTTLRRRAGGVALALAVTGSVAACGPRTPGSETPYKGSIAVVCGETEEAEQLGMPAQGSNAGSRITTEMGIPGEQVVVHIPTGSSDELVGARIVDNEGKVISDVNLALLSWQSNNRIGDPILGGINGENVFADAREASWYSPEVTAIGVDRPDSGVKWRIHTTYNNGIHGIDWTNHTDILITCPGDPAVYAPLATPTASPSAN